MLTLPQRFGEKPKTHYGLPHTQLDQTPPDDIYGKLKDRGFDFPFVERRPSIISVPGAEALWLLEEGGHSCEGAFMRGNEFAHIHPPEDGSMHMMIAPDDAADVIDKGWAEIHPLVPVGRMPPSLILVFGPRDDAELDIVLTLLDASYRYARGIGIDC